MKAWDNVEIFTKASRYNYSSRWLVNRRIEVYIVTDQLYYYTAAALQAKARTMKTITFILLKSSP